MRYITAKNTPIYVVPGAPNINTAIGPGHSLELLAYTGGKYALVKNPKSERQFIVEWDSLKQEV